MWPFNRKSKNTPEEEAELEQYVLASRFLGDPKAKELHDRLLAKDWAAARQILMTAESPQHFAFYVIKAADTGGIMQWIDDEIGKEPFSTLPLLVKGARAVRWAWEARGTGGSDTVSEEAWKIWFSRLKTAEDCLDGVIDREPQNVEAWHWLIVLARAREVSKEECWRRFRGLEALDPYHYYGNSQMLEGLKRKWFGSTEEMFAFARQRAAFGPGTNLPVLIALAHEEQSHTKSGYEYWGDPEIAAEVLQAAEQSIWHPDYRRNLQTPILWNEFAKAFSKSNQFPEAQRCFDEIGDDYIQKRTWSVEQFLGWRGYVEDRV